VITPTANTPAAKPAHTALLLPTLTPKPPIEINCPNFVFYKHAVEPFAIFGKSHPKDPYPWGKLYNCECTVVTLPYTRCVVKFTGVTQGGHNVVPVEE
jgi:hypothetical protein